MILNKNQIIDFLLTDIPVSYHERMRRKLLSSPELYFLSLVKHDINWSLEPVRRNLYIVTAQ